MEGLQLPVEAIPGSGDVQNSVVHEQLPEVKTEVVNIASEADDGDSVNLKVLCKHVFIPLFSDS